MRGFDFSQQTATELSMFSNKGHGDAHSPPILRADATSQWHVLHVRSRQEKALCRDLAQRGIGHYLPLVGRPRGLRQRKLPVELPLYAGYVFLLGTIEQAFAADRTGRLARIIPVFNQEQMDWELANLQLAMHHRPTLLPHPFLNTGRRVKVCGGPFRGVQGILERKSAPNRLILQVTTVAKAVSLEIDPSLVQPLE
jgi:transcription termination/antitermination protein NusG